MRNFLIYLPLLALFGVGFLAAQTCPQLNLQSTPRFVAPDKTVIVALRQPDGSFMGYTGPRIAPYLVGSQIPNFQTAITSCYPGPAKKGSAPFTSLVRQGSGAYLADYADLDGDGVQDAVLIAYKPNLVFQILMAASNVPKSGYPLPLPLPGSPVAIRIADLNKDGRPDLIVSTRSAPSGSPAGQIYVLLNNGNGSFATPAGYLAGANPQSFAIADVNKDGNLDIVVADQGDGTGNGVGGGVAILLGTGTGTFSSPSFVQTNAPTLSVIVDDFNGDRNVDIAAATGSTVRLFTGNGAGGFTARPSFPSGGDSSFLAMGDFNGDGKLDLVSSNYQEQTASVLLNDGSSGGGFLAPTSYVISRGRSIDYLVVTDFNNDGIPDIVGGSGSPYAFAGNSNNALDVLLGNGDGTFAAPPVVQVGTTPLAFALAGDFNNDGKMDVVAMSQRTNTLFFYAGKGDGTVAAPVSTTLGGSFNNALGAIPGDFNGDGVADLAILTNTGVSIALSQKNGSFQPLNQIYQTATSTNNIAVGDFNGDGKLDFATPICSTSGGPTTIHVYNGSGTGAFTDSQPFRMNYCPAMFTQVDINGDKRADIVALNNTGASGAAYASVDVIINQGQGLFANPRSYGLDPVGIVAMALVDVNGDGKPDVVAASLATKPFNISTIINNGDGTFGAAVSTPITVPPIGILGADLNGDSKGDLILVPTPKIDSASNDLTSLVGMGDGTFLPPVHVAGPNSTGLQFADFNNDNRPDLLVTSAGNAPTGYFMVIPTGPPPSAPPPVVTTVNGASFASGAPVAPDSIASTFGSNLAAQSNLAGTKVTVRDSAGATQNSNTLFYVSPVQVNFQVPPSAAPGVATITVTAADGTATSGSVQIANVAPGIFAAGGGVYAGRFLRVGADGSQTEVDSTQPVNIGNDQIFLIMYGTGIKKAARVTATINGLSVPVAFAGPQGSFVGEDQVNVGPLPSSLAGAGKVNIVITADGIAANTVSMTIQ
jgi:uncharacterized protein (TIGR03437 family)